MSERQVPDPPKRVEDLLEKDIRKYLSESDEAVSREYSLQKRDGTVRCTLIREARKESSPKQVTQWYDPKQRITIIPLPNPDQEDDDE